jgi:transposase
MNKIRHISLHTYMQGVDKITETLQNSIIAFVYVGYIKRTSISNECSSICLHSVVLVESAFVIVLSGSPCERNGKWETCLIFERGQMVGVHLAGASVTKVATLLGVLSARVSKIISANTNHGKTTSAKRNSGRKSALTESECCTLKRIVVRTHKTTAAQLTEELNIHLEDSVSTKTV